MKRRIRAVGGKWDGETRDVEDWKAISWCFYGHGPDHEDEYVLTGEISDDGAEIVRPLENDSA